MDVKKIMITVAILVSLVSVLAVVQTEDGSVDDGCCILFDYGNGKTVWGDASTGETIKDVITRTSETKGIAFQYDGSKITIDGIDTVVIGGDSTGGSMSIPGTTGVKVESKWQLFVYDNGWKALPLSDIGNKFDGKSYAVGYYPDGTIPVETPGCQTSWTMIRGDAEQTGQQESEFSATSPAVVKWNKTDSNGVYSAVLYANGHIYAKFGAGQGMASAKDAYLKCLSMDGKEIWSFTYAANGFYETATPLIVGDYIYVVGYDLIYKVPCAEGPGENNVNVKTLQNMAYNDVVKKDEKGEYVKDKKYTIPSDIEGHTYFGQSYNTGPGSLVYSSGCIYMMCSNGMVYCYNLDLELVWSSMRDTRSYYISPTVIDDYVFSGDLGGRLYVMDKKDGTIIDKDVVYYSKYMGQEYGCVNAISVLKNGSGYDLFFTFSDGRGMSSMVGGIAHYSFNGKELTKLFIDTSIGMPSNYSFALENQSFKGAYFNTSSGLYRIDTENDVKLLVSGIPEVHAPMLLVNKETIYFASYTSGQYLFITDLDGHVKKYIDSPLGNYNMSPVTVIGDYVLVGNDSGMSEVYGVFESYVPPVEDNTNYLLLQVVMIMVIIAIIIIIYYCIARFVFHIEKPIDRLGEKMNKYLEGDQVSHNTRSRHRLKFVVIIGTILILLAFIACLCIGPTSKLSLSEMFDALCSAIAKGGKDLTGNEVIVYSSRLPRLLAALAVGVGLSIAGCIYQAIIRNPLCDPYIMGVSAGAGTAAVAVIALNFTFFGLFSAHSIFLTAIAAMIGGLVAFGCTMLIAEKAGGSSTNYVLAGVVVGLAFSAVQTLMMTMAGQKITNALTWLFGSFSNISWEQLWLVFVPALVLSFISLLWAKEFNLVLLGEEQARQMGLDVKNFTRFSLILASVLTSICVAFVGIIGFVGLVVPHFCRMILGGDHRLVLPSSIVVGALLMILADFASRMLMPGMELPVGAITTVIGVPVFAYMLIVKGRMYDG